MTSFLQAALPFALAVVMVGLGLTLTVGDFKAQSGSKVALALTVLAQCVLVPLLGFGVAALLDLPPAIAVGLVLAAATPGGATSNVMTHLARGNVALGIVMTVITSLLAMVALPFWVTRALDSWSVTTASGAEVTVPFSEILSLLVNVIFIPIVIGLGIRKLWPGVAARLERMVSAFSVIVMLGLMISIVVDLGEEAIPMMRLAGPATFLVTIGACAAGLVLGLVARLPRGDTMALTCELSIKNVTLGMVIGLSVLESGLMTLPSAVMAVVMYVPVALIVYAYRRWFHRHEVTDVQAG